MLPDDLRKWWKFWYFICLSVTAPEWRRGISSLKFGLQPEHSHLSCFERFSVGFAYVLPVFYSGGRSVRCVCYKVTFLCGVVSSTTGLTGWEDRSRSCVSLIICIVRVGIVWSFIVGVGVCLSTTIVIVGIFGTIRVISGLVFFSFQLTALILIVTWLFAMLASWSGPFRGLLWGLMRHSVYLHFICGFQTI